MPVIKGLEWTFDTVSDRYAKLRPGYTDGVYQAIFDYADIDSASEAVEVGIGGGQATLPILKTGCAVTAVECGENLARLCAEKFSSFERFSVITDKFENVAFDEGRYDLVFSASAFHWVPEEIGYPKVFSMLKRGGAFARFANHPFRDKGNPALADAIDRLYAEYYYPYYNKPVATVQEYSEADAADRARIAAGYGFTDIRYAMFYRTRSFSALEYTELLGTYSDHINIEEEIRKKFFGRIEEAINDHGGTFTVYDTIDLQLARKP